MAKPDIRTTKDSEPQQVDAYMRALKHPLKQVAELLRCTVLGADPRIGEEIKWNAPAFFYTGPLSPFDPKLHKRHVAVLNLFKKDCVRVVFPTGASIQDHSGLLTGDYADGRRLALFSTVEDLQSKKRDLIEAVRTWVRGLDLE